MPTPAERQAQRRARRRAEGKLPPITPPKWHEAHPVTCTVGVPQVVKDYLATPEGRQEVLGLATGWLIAVDPLTHARRYPF